MRWNPDRWNRSGKSAAYDACPFVRREMVWMACCAVSWATVDIAPVLFDKPFAIVQIVWWRYAAHLGVAALVWRVRRKQDER